MMYVVCHIDLDVEISKVISMVESLNAEPSTSQQSESTPSPPQASSTTEPNPPGPQASPTSSENGTQTYGATNHLTLTLNQATQLDLVRDVCIVKTLPTNKPKNATPTRDERPLEDF